MAVDQAGTIKGCPPLIVRLFRRNPPFYHPTTSRNHFPSHIVREGRRFAQRNGNVAGSIPDSVPSRSHASEFVPAVGEIARHYGIPPLEYCRRALLLRLKADGVCLEEYEGEAA